MKKTFLLSLSLISCLSLANAEDNGFFVSVGYQIGQATQIAKNTGELQKLNDSYKDLQNNLFQLQELNRAVADGSDQNKIQSAITSLQAFSNNNFTGTTYSPAYQGVNLALRMAIMAWTIFLGNGNLGWKMQSTYKQTGQEINQLAKQIIEGFNKITTLNTDNRPANQDIKGETLAEVREVKNANHSTLTTTPQGLLTLAKQMMDKFASMDIYVVGDGKRYTGQTQNTLIKQNPVLLKTQAALKNAQSLINATYNLNTTQNNLQQKQSGEGANTSEFNQKFQQAAKEQQQVLSLAQSIVDDYKAMPQGAQDAFKDCTKILNTKQDITGSEKFSICANPAESATATQASINYYGNQPNSNLQLANDVINLANNKTALKNTFASTQSLGARLDLNPNSKLALQNIVYSTNNPNAPTIDRVDYHINPIQQSNLTNALAAMSANPFRNIGVIKSQGNSGVMNGIGVQLGYKQFFGATKRMGARYYGFFDYNHTYIKSDFFNSASNVLTYGVGSDFLYNFINDKEMKKNRLSFGGFAGIALAGTSWLNSDKAVLLNTPEFNASNTPYKASVSASNFQFLFNFGLRMNLADNSKKNEHAIQHGIELGIKIPTINTSYYSFLGAKLEYRRLYSVYLNYVFAY
ncbi:Hop family adhesin SabA/HopD [Helicobacter cetorum]|uniref:Outer membrane protein 5 n=1 Tax=Helicobacter cetorum (strain ATCC BAA-540 / CCUG 52418 / MIT 99-5656) TaxID=1163745 RepID=I0EUC8_HELCM|nr:outer membrane protein [Helicobacter cetorum]AFI06547.1 outer membrane protein 5 [Helicobacter cetorum MIT 99-5656]